MQEFSWFQMSVNKLFKILGLSKVPSANQTRQILPLHIYTHYESVILHHRLQLFSQDQNYHSLCGTTSPPLDKPDNCFKNRELWAEQHTRDLEKCCKCILITLGKRNA